MRCAFCEVDAVLIKEHAVARWLHSELPPQPKQHYRRETQGRIEVGGFYRQVTEPRLIGHPLIATQPKIVCKRCNTGWMSRLQKEVVPTLRAMIRGEVVTLDCVSRHTLTAWIAMTTMVGDYAQFGRAAISQAERTELYRHCEMNDTLSLHDWEISIGEYIGSELDNPYRRRYRYRIGASSTAQATTLRLGAAFLTAHSGLGALPGIIPILAAASFQPALIAVHPNAHETAWPPWLKVHDVLAERIVFRVREALQIGLSTNAPGFEQAGIEVRDRIDQQPDEWPPQQRRTPP